MNNANDLKRYLETYCLGRSSAQVASAILRTCPTLTDRQIRTWAKQLRLAGEPICSDSYIGYWWANTADELSATMLMLKRRALGSLKQASHLKRFALPGVVGQLALDLPEPLLVEMPEELHSALLRYQVNHPSAQQNEIIVQALTLFLASAKAQEFQPCDS